MLERLFRAQPKGLVFRGERRTKVVGVFPNEKSLANLATVLMLRANVHLRGG